jgi:hypothetical protein
MNVLGRKVAAAAVAVTCAATGMLIAMPASAEADTTPPSVPQNLRDATLFAAGNPVLNWDPSTDVGTGVSHYWVIVDGQQRARPAGTSYDIQTLVDLGRITAGPHRITVQAVDFAANRSAPSAPIDIVVIS